MTAVDAIAGRQNAARQHKAKLERLAAAGVRKATVAAGDWFMHRASKGKVRVLEVKGMQARVIDTKGRTRSVAIVNNPGVGLELGNYVRCDPPEGYVAPAEEAADAGA